MISGNGPISHESFQYQNHDSSRRMEVQGVHGTLGPKQVLEWTNSMIINDRTHNESFLNTAPSPANRRCPRFNGGDADDKLLPQFHLGH
jgi:hypothetical protein